MTKNALVPVTEANYPVLVHGQEAIDLIRQNMAGEEVSPADLPRITVPTGGSLFWTGLLNEQGEETASKTLDGVILHIARRRALWASNEPSNDPPICSATGDCLVGIGEPGGECKTCPFNQYGTAVKADGTAGRGKLCKERKLLFVLPPGRLLPYVVSVPPASLKGMRQYQFSLGVPFCCVVTRLELIPATNADGTKYAQVKPSLASKIEPEQAKKLMAYAKELQAVFAGVEMEQDAGAGQVVA